MNQLQIIEQNDKRVLTTGQLAESYGADKQLIINNFNRNKNRYKEGKHYFVLYGQEKNNFIDQHQFDLSSKNATSFYLWTEKGAWLHAKSLNTDQAWDAYEMLVDDYYTAKNNVVPLSKDQALVTVLRTTADLVEDNQAIKSEQLQIRKELTQINAKVEEQITLDHGEQRRLQKAVANRVYEIEENAANRPKLFREIYREIKDRFAVASYKDVKRRELLSAIHYVENYIPRKVS